MGTASGCQFWSQLPFGASHNLVALPAVAAGPRPPRKAPAEARMRVGRAGRSLHHASPVLVGRPTPALVTRSSLPAQPPGAPLPPLPTGWLPVEEDWLHEVGFGTLQHMSRDWGGGHIARPP